MDMLLDCCILLLGFFVGSIIASLFYVLVACLIAKTKGWPIRSFSFLFWKWERDLYSEGAGAGTSDAARGDVSGSKAGTANLPPMKVRVTKFQFFAKVQFSLIAADKKFNLTCHIVYTLVALPIIAVFLYLHIKTSGPLESFCEAIWLSFLAIAVSEWIVMARKDPAKEKLLEIMQTIRDASPEDHISLPTMEEFESLHPSLMIRVTFYFIGYLVGEQENNFAKIQEMADQLMKQNYSSLPSNTKIRIDSKMMSYFSFRMKDPERATFFYNRSKKDIDADMDANGRRRLAYYAYYALGDAEMARKYLDQGLEALKVPDTLRTRYENGLEEKMLKYLKSVLDQRDAEASSKASAGSSSTGFPEV
ncbi:MAG: hypothetical protein J5752_02460 [Clostridiales bacterium]|nr:hypothetical protein [Clostridiales bacterium]